MLRIIVLDSNIIIEFERIKKTFGNRSFRKAFLIFIGSFCKGDYIILPSSVVSELKINKVIEAIISILGNSVGFSNSNMRNIGEADAINQILKYRNMNKVR